MQSVWQPPVTPVVEVEDDDGPSPWLLVDVWLSPRQVVRTVLDHGGGWYGVLPLLMAYGVAALEMDGVDALPVARVVGFGVLMPLFGVIGAGMEAVMLWLSATVQGIPTSVKDLMVAGAWGRVPRITGGLIALPAAMALALGVTGQAIEVAGVATGGVALLMWVWGAVVHMHALGEVMRVSAVRALGVFVAPYMLLFGGSLMLALVAMALVSSF